MIFNSLLTLIIIIILTNYLSHCSSILQTPTRISSKKEDSSSSTSKMPPNSAIENTSHKKKSMTPKKIRSTIRSNDIADAISFQSPTRSNVRDFSLHYCINFLLLLRIYFSQLQFRGDHRHQLLCLHHHLHLCVIKATLHVDLPLINIWTIMQSVEVAIQFFFLPTETTIQTKPSKQIL